MSTQVPLQHGVTQSGDNVFSNSGSGSFNTFNTTLLMPVFVVNANDVGDVLRDVVFSRARHDTGRPDDNSHHHNTVDDDNSHHHNAVDEDNTFCKPTPSASSPAAAPPHGRDAEPIVDDILQHCGSCSNFDCCHAQSDGSYVSTSTCATTATRSPQSTAASTSLLPADQTADVSGANAAIELDDSDELEMGEELEMGNVNPQETDDDLAKIADAKVFNLNTRQSAASKREQLTRHLVQAAAFNISDCKNDYADAWDLYRDIFKHDVKAQAARAAGQALPAPSRPSQHDINNAIADRIWREENNMNLQYVPFGYADQLKEHDAKKATRDAAKTRKLAQSAAPGNDVDGKLPSAATSTAASAPVQDAAVPVDGADYGDDDDVDDGREDRDVMYVALTIDSNLVVIDREQNVQLGAHVDTGADAHLTVEQGLQFWSEHAAIQKRTDSKHQQRDSDDLVDKLHAERLAASRLRRAEHWSPT
jgi:hypothetical protein